MIKGEVRRMALLLMRIFRESGISWPVFMPKQRLIKKLAEFGQFPEYDPNYNGAVARSALWCDYQEEYNGRIYEYWLMMQSSIAKSCLYCEFLVTEAQSKGSERKIIHRANQFFRTYQVDDKFSVIFPDDAYRKHRTSYGFCPNCPK